MKNHSKFQGFNLKPIMGVPCGTLLYSTGFNYNPSRGSKENHFTFQGTFKSFIYLIKNPGTMMDKTGRQSEEKPTGESASFFWKESKVSFGLVDHNHDRQISGRTRPSGRH